MPNTDSMHATDEADWGLSYKASAICLCVLLASHDVMAERDEGQFTHAS